MIYFVAYRLKADTAGLIKELPSRADLVSFCDELRASGGQVICVWCEWRGES